MKGLLRVLAITAVALAGAARSGGGSDAASGVGMSLKVASFDLVAVEAQRFQVGLVDDRDELVLVGGTVTLSFRRIDEGDDRGTAVEPPPDTPATFVPLAGEPERSPTATPSFVAGTAGVYRNDPISFPSAGFWEVEARAETTGGPRRAAASFSVAASSVIPRPGDAAPATANPLADDAGVPLHAIDSRADATGVPDPELHSTTIAAALETHRPIVVVVSTPTFCESRFCGPITDSVEALARRSGDRVAFVHLEVWRDFDANELNPAAQERVDPDRTYEGNEPWVFVVDSNGVIVERFDNVASDADLRRAVAEVVP